MTNHYKFILFYMGRTCQHAGNNSFLEVYLMNDFLRMITNRHNYMCRYLKNVENIENIRHYMPNISFFSNVHILFKIKLIHKPRTVANN